MYQNGIKLKVKIPVEMSRIGQSIETENKLVDRDWGERSDSKHMVSFEGDRSVLELDSSVMVVQLCEYTKNHLKMANFIYVDFISTFKN